ncbi:LysR family transcriptional regulator [Sinirhodobacter populi]|uniref:LysR family transcriptional regulator n=3 Tax=Paenirhodobacter populi TaxID=2306993 RepID=A0A443JJ51_9RHOB|nr:LysR family transcriptional regulator [Sinirhodobacter populi]
MAGFGGHRDELPSVFMCQIRNPIAFRQRPRRDGREQMTSADRHSRLTPKLIPGPPMPHMPNFRQVTAFLSVARHLHFTIAAQELRMSQPAVTSQIRLLENQLDIKLFDRTKREVVLTAAGRDLLPIMERLALNMEELVAASGDLAQGRRGLVRVAALPSVAASLLPIALADFAGRNPNVDVEIADVVADEVVDLIKSDQVDFGIGIRLTADRSLRTEPLMTDRLCVFCREDHPLATRTGPLTLHDCAPFPMIVTRRNSSVRSILARATMRLEGGVTIALETHYMSTALGAARAGLGITILPAAAREAGSMAGLVCRAMNEPDLVREFSLISHANRSLQPIASDLMSALRRAAASEADDLFQSV